LKSLLSQEEKRHILLRQLALSGLLHLEFQKLDKKSALPLTECNQIIQNWIRKQSRSSQYKPLKKKLKTLLQHTQGTKVDLESMFLELINYHDEARFTDLEEYLLLIRSIETSLGTTVMISTPEEVDLNYRDGKSFICVLTHDLNAHFSSQGKMVKPITFLAKVSLFERSSLATAVYKFNTFRYQPLYDDEAFVRFNLDKNRSETP